MTANKNVPGGSASPASPTPARRARVRSPSVVTVTTPPELIIAVEGINKRIGELVAEQQARNVERRTEVRTGRVPVPVVVEVKRSGLWGIIAGLILVAILLALVGIWRTMLTTASQSQPRGVTPSLSENTYASKKEVATLRGTSEMDIAAVKDELAKVAKLAVTKAELKKLESKVDEKVVPAKEAVIVSAPVWRVNILLVDEYGRVPECFKGVLVSDIIQKGRHTHFMFNGKPVDWNQRVVLSYSYADNNPPITGAIYYTPAAGAAVKVINVPPYNVYQDSDGTIRYDDLGGGFPCAPKGAGYITSQSTLPDQR